MVAVLFRGMMCPSFVLVIFLFQFLIYNAPLISLNASFVFSFIKPRLILIFSHHPLFYSQKSHLIIGFVENLTPQRIFHGCSLLPHKIICLFHWRQRQQRLYHVGKIYVSFYLYLFFAFCHSHIATINRLFLRILMKEFKDFWCCMDVYLCVGGFNRIGWMYLRI